MPGYNVELCRCQDNVEWWRCMLDGWLYPCGDMVDKRLDFSLQKIRFFIWHEKIMSSPFALLDETVGCCIWINCIWINCIWIYCPRDHGWVVAFEFIGPIYWIYWPRDHARWRDGPRETETNGTTMARHSTTDRVHGTARPSTSTETTTDRRRRRDEEGRDEEG